jgi:hypothetical protein
MGNAAQRIGYKNCTQAAATTVKSGPAALYGLTVTASTGGTVTIYDNTAASGTVLFTKSSLAVGDVIHFGGNALAAGNGLHVVCGGTATVNVMFL